MRMGATEGATVHVTHRLGASVSPAEPQPSFNTALSMMKRESPFFSAPGNPGNGIEMKEAAPNLLLGQYHRVEHRQRQLVGPHPGARQPGTVRRQTPSPDLL